jgi:hypothetical protein
MALGNSSLAFRRPILVEAEPLRRRRRLKIV